ncbi:MAG: YggT family protein [Candidatus Eremiobacteraeota bacterium]|nr:YggT family protein [Candidatus Eremiobacteraeota bacterium]
MIGCQLLQGISWALWIYTIIMLVYAVVSWIPDLRGRWSDYVGMVVEPVVAPVRRLIPPAGGFDWSFLIVLIGFQVLIRIINSYIATSCYL